MLSRRNTRIKVMQSLYALEIDNALTFNDIKKAYKALAIDTFNLYLYALYALVEFCKISVDDKKKREQKYLPTDADRDFQPIIFTNKFLQSIYKNTAFKVKCKNENFQDRINTGILARLYKEYSATDEYLKYVYKEEHSDEDHIEILHDVLRFLKNSESFCEMMDESYANWIDDDSLVLGALKRTLKSLPVEESFFMEYYPDHKTLKEFGERLLDEVHAREKELSEKIGEVLENWDLDRLAVLDLVILKMGIVELLYFDKIPNHVTINEYVEMAKLYSTSKSRVFINGILDKIMKDLEGDSSETQETQE